LQNSRNNAAKFVNPKVLQEGWPIYREFEVEYSDDDVLIYAPRVVQEIPAVSYDRSVPIEIPEDENRVRVYAPLQETPDLFLKFAGLRRHKAKTRDEAAEIMLNWAKNYGVLGLYPGNDRRESLTRFVSSARRAARCLELYEAATVETGGLPDPDIETLEKLSVPGKTAKQKREAALEEVEVIVGVHLEDECYLRPYRRVNRQNGMTLRFEQGYGFRSLRGAMYLQMMWLMEVGHPPRCKGPGCNRIIRIGKYAPGARELAEESRHKGGRPRRYKTRKDKEYCSDNCRVKAHYHEVVKPRKQQRAGKS
jgi:hypothetical protein